MPFVVCCRPWHLPGCSGGIGSERPMPHRVYKRVNAVLSDKVEKQVNEPLEAKSEILRLRAQMRRLEEERDILKKAARYFAREPE